jgi:ribosomal-protein-alanine N-acetyltransferase
LKTIKTPRLTLRPLADSDVDALFTIFSDAEVTAYWSSVPLADRAAAEELLASIRSAQDLMQWGITRTGEDRVIGTCTLFAINLPHKRAEVGYALGRAWWNQGIALEAVSGLLHHAFDDLGLHRIEADVDPRNAASLRLLERLGFRREGYARERWHVGGEINDGVLFGLLRRELAPRSNF